ncbi:MAG TPA: DNA-3-methyladenine glycosylase [Devosia sp.]|jgi:DNA-3-methyladenine glycosylase|nr:DNA-3-methyladenine glycosylase [Devosia sp.]
MNLVQFLDRDAAAVAPDLLGARLLLDGVGGVITETEAYHPEDAASHSFRGPTPRNRSMFAGPGCVYVYRSYGIHWCLNFVCRGASAVLIRALEPTDGVDRMRERRGIDDLRALCSGPGKLCAALGVTGELDGRMLTAPPFEVVLPEQSADLVIGPRIGITKAADVPWRFGVKGSRFLSRPFPKA